MMALKFAHAKKDSTVANGNFAFEFAFFFVSLFQIMLKWAFESELFAMILKFLFLLVLNVFRSLDMCY